MKETRRQLGARAEERAKEALLRQGYRILSQNFSCRLGELDFVALKDGVLCFIEIRSRSSTRFGLPQETVRPRKQRRLAYAAKCFLQENFQEDPPPPCRFDVVGLYPAPDGTEQVEIVENAFETPL